VQPIDFREGHEVLGEDEDSESYCLELKVALFFESQDGQNHNDRSLEGGFPKPNEEVD